MGWGESRRARAMDWRAGSEAGFRLLAADARLDRTGSPSQRALADGRRFYSASMRVSGRRGTSMKPRMSTADSPWRAAGERFVDAKN